MTASHLPLIPIAARRSTPSLGPPVHANRMPSATCGRPAQRGGLAMANPINWIATWNAPSHMTAVSSLSDTSAQGDARTGQVLASMIPCWAVRPTIFVSSNGSRASTSTAKRGTCSSTRAGRTDGAVGHAGNRAMIRHPDPPRESGAPVLRSGGVSGTSIRRATPARSPLLIAEPGSVP